MSFSRANTRLWIPVAGFKFEPGTSTSEASEALAGVRALRSRRSQRGGHAGVLELLSGRRRL
jgi:hypothetical protein